MSPTAAAARIRTACGERALRISVIGVTGHVGAAVLELIDAAPECFSVVALTCNGEIGRLTGLARRHRAQFAAAADGEGFSHLRDLLRGSGIAPGGGDRAVEEAARLPADLVVIAVPGMIGLGPAFAALGSGADIALADTRVAAVAGDELRRLAAAGVGVGLLTRGASAVPGGAAAAVDHIVSLMAAEALALDRGADATVAERLLVAVEQAGIRGGAIRREVAAIAPYTQPVGRNSPFGRIAPPRSGDSPSTVPLDRIAAAMLKSAREAIRYGASARAAWCGAADIALAGLAERRIVDHDVASVVAELVARLRSEGALGQAVDGDAGATRAAIEAADLSARLVAYELLENTALGKH